MPVRHYRRLLAGTIALIAYGSFFPFAFTTSPHFGDFWAVPQAPGSFRDVLLNLLLYMPIGFLAYHSVAWRSRSARVIAAGMFGAALSTAVELAQAFDISRDAGASDIVCNGLGAFAGAVVAALWHAGAPPALRVSMRTRARGPAFVLVFWIVFQVFPLMPQTHLRFAMAAAIGGLHRWSGFEAALFATDWLTALLLLREAIPAEDWVMAPLLALLAPLKAILFSRQLTLSELAGAAIAVVAFVALARWRLFTRWLWPILLLAALVARELAPFHATGHAAFSWIPFGATLAGDRLATTTILFRKAFVYGAVIQAWAAKLGRVWPVASSMAALLFALEWAQRAMPARTPEITDAVLAILMGAGLALLQRHREPSLGNISPSHIR